MGTGRPTAPLILTMSERETLQQWTRRPKTAQALAQRARIILACASGQPNTAVARDVRVAQQTVCKWRQRFVTHRLDGLLDEPRPGAPRRGTDVDVERMAPSDLGDNPYPRDPLEHPRHGAAERSEPEYRASYLASLWPSAASE